MKEKGISSTAVLVVIVLVVLAGVGYFFLARGSKERMPVYPEATHSEVSELWLELFATFESHGISASMYTTGASSNEVLNWYRSEMSERGWTKILDNTLDNFHILSFQMGNEGAGIIKNESTLVLMHGAIEEFLAVVVEWYQELRPSLPPATPLPEYTFSIEYPEELGHFDTMLCLAAMRWDNITLTAEVKSLGKTIRFRLSLESAWEGLPPGINYEIPEEYEEYVTLENQESVRIPVTIKVSDAQPGIYSLLAGGGTIENVVGMAIGFCLAIGPPWENLQHIYPENLVTPPPLP